MASNSQLEKPKRAKSSYMFFCDERRPTAIEANRAKNGGKMKMQELSKELSHSWGQLGNDEKAKYETLAAVEKEKRDEAMKAYLDSTRIEGLMKRPQSAYFQFINSNRTKIQEEHNITSIADVGRKAAELWRAMSDDEKKPFEEQYHKDKAAYEMWKGSDTGKEALAKQKAMKPPKKEDYFTTPRRGVKRAADDIDMPEYFDTPTDKWHAERSCFEYFETPPKKTLAERSRFQYCARIVGIEKHYAAEAGERLRFKRDRRSSSAPNAIAVYDGPLGCHVGYLEDTVTSHLSPFLDQNTGARITGRVAVKSSDAFQADLQVSAPAEMRSELDALENNLHGKFETPEENNLHGKSDIPEVPVVPESADVAGFADEEQLSHTRSVNTQAQTGEHQ